MGGKAAQTINQHTLENQRRVYRCVELLTTCRHKFEMVKVVREEFGVSRRQAERYLHTARLIAIEAVKADRDALVAHSHATYLSIITDPNADNRDKIRAQEAIDRLLGLSAPFKVAPTNPSGDASWQQESTDDLRSKLVNRLLEPSPQ